MTASTLITTSKSGERTGIHAGIAFLLLFFCGISEAQTVQPARLEFGEIANNVPLLLTYSERFTVSNTSEDVLFIEEIHNRAFLGAQVWPSVEHGFWAYEIPPGDSISLAYQLTVGAMPERDSFDTVRIVLSHGINTPLDTLRIPVDFELVSKFEPELVSVEGEDDFRTGCNAALSGCNAYATIINPGKDSLYLDSISVMSTTPGGIMVLDSVFISDSQNDSTYHSGPLPQLILPGMRAQWLVQFPSTPEGDRLLRCVAYTHRPDGRVYETAGSVHLPIRYYHGTVIGDNGPTLAPLKSTYTQVPVGRGDSTQLKIRLQPCTPVTFPLTVESIGFAGQRADEVSLLSQAPDLAIQPIPYSYIDCKGAANFRILFAPKSVGKTIDTLVLVVSYNDSSGQRQVRRETSPLYLEGTAPAEVDRPMEFPESSKAVRAEPRGALLDLAWSGLDAREVRVMIYDMEGRAVLSTMLASEKKSGAIDIAALPAGLYVLSVDGAGGEHGSARFTLVR